jgi:hypothetical protein
MKKHQSILLNESGKTELLQRCGENNPRLIKAVYKEAQVISFRISDGSYLIKFPGINKHFSVPGSGIGKYHTDLR